MIDCRRRLFLSSRSGASLSAFGRFPPPLYRIVTVDIRREVASRCRPVFTGAVSSVKLQRSRRGRERFLHGLSSLLHAVNKVDARRSTCRRISCAQVERFLHGERNHQSTITFNLHEICLTTFFDFREYSAADFLYVNTICRIL